MSIQSNSGPIVRSGSQERDYLLRRAADHDQLADLAQESGPRGIHVRLGQLYREQAALIGMVFPD